ncbi:ATP-binding cassette domain-containing protein [Gammaproteobacteria bacterium]|nr:ATP-binding cassette domain-containing protein [Gammaproteobacteria bacterium]
MQINNIEKNNVQIEVKNLDMVYGSYIVQKNINFSVKKSEIFIIMGDSGCGKSTLMRHMVGLKKPSKGDIFYHQNPFWETSITKRQDLMRNFGVMYQSGALWSSMTISENVELPLRKYTSLTNKQIKEVVAFKLSLVGLAGYENFYPSEISGGMCKRAGIARAIALDPEIIFFDEPSAGLDPISSKRLDDLILTLRDGLGATILVVTHELASIFAIADYSIFLDSENKTSIAHGPPKELLKYSTIPKIQQFLTRGTKGVSPI